MFVQNVAHATESAKTRGFRQMVQAEGLRVVKCSGKTIGDGALGSIARLSKSGKASNLVVVHGGGIEITRAVNAAGLRAVFRDGYRVTDAPTMEIVERVLRGINTEVSERLRAMGLETEPFMYGVFHGEPMGGLDRHGSITRVCHDGVACALLSRRIPVLAPIGNDSIGGKLNLNADDAAVSVAVALGATQLILATDVDGILAGGGVMPDITVSALAGLIRNGAVSGGMLAKARACIMAANGGVPARIVNGNDPGAIALAFEGNGGTAVLPAGAGAEDYSI